MSDKFPTQRYGSASAYFSGYANELRKAALGVDGAQIDKAASLLAGLFESGRMLFVCGNGGSAAISNHLTCDVSKGVQTDTDVKPRVVSLSTQLELITAIANDIEYAEVFVYQLRTLARPRDALLVISSSGNSENVVRALEWAKANRLETLAMTGFSGGRCAEIADINLHVPAANYGVVEDTHQSMMHVLAQYLRQARMPEPLIASRAF